MFIIFRKPDNCKKKQTEPTIKTAEITEEKIQPTPAPEIKTEAQPQEKEEKNNNK